jgi:phosphoglycerate dehydrogenase-like enzyme
MIIPVTETEYYKGKPVFDSATDFAFVPVSAQEDQLARFIVKHQCQACVLGVEHYRKELYTALPKGGLILRFGVGTDGIDRKQLKENSILLANTPGTLDQSVAEHTIFLIGSLVRHICHENAQVKSGRWHSSIGHELGELTLAIVGFGRIGSIVAKIAHQGFQMDLLVCDISDPTDVAQRLGYESAEKMNADLGLREWHSDSAEILPKADIVTVHLPLLPATEGYFNKVRFNQVKPGAYFINTSRGKLVIEDDLVEALEKGKLAGAALDVFQNEPYQVIGSDLRKIDNLIMTPHVASNTRAANHKMAYAVIETLAQWVHGAKQPINLVI